MLARRVSVSSIDQLLDPAGGAWARAEGVGVVLIATPPALQPTAYLRVAYADRNLPKTDRVQVSVVHDGTHVAFHLSWGDSSETREMQDTNQFVDGAAILLPVKDDAPLIQMGSPAQPVNAWYWRADAEKDRKGRHVYAEGLGTTRTVDTDSVRVSSLWKEGRWHVVIGRAMKSASEFAAQLSPGAKTKFGVAVWEGAAGERGGIKAFSAQWNELELAKE